jgi:SAM-dependent methyltransferase
MRVSNTYKRLNFGRDIVAFLDLKLRQVSKKQKEQIAKQKEQIAKQKERIAKQKEQIASKEQRIARLKEEIIRMRAKLPVNEKLEGIAEPVEDSEGWHGLGLKSGDPHYRSWVGRPETYDLKASIQVSLLLAVGLRENHRLVEVGCGSLRAGRMLIPYLSPGHYFGIEPNRWVVEDGIKHELGESILEVKRPTFRFVDDFSADGFGIEFDFALAQSVFSHTYPDMTLAGLRGISKALAPDGKIIANFVEGETTTENGSGWVYPGCTTYTWQRIYEMLEESGLVGRKLNWMQGMQWFIAARPEFEGDVDDLAHRLRPPLRKPRKGNPQASST